MPIRISLLVLVTSLFVAICMTDQTPKASPQKSVAVPAVQVTPDEADESTATPTTKPLTSIAPAGALIVPVADAITESALPPGADSVEDAVMDSARSIDPWRHVGRMVLKRKNLKYLARRLVVLRDEIALAERDVDGDAVPWPATAAVARPGSMMVATVALQDRVSLADVDFPRPQHMAAGRYRVVNDRGEVRMLDVAADVDRQVSEAKPLYTVTQGELQWYFIRLHVELLPAPEMPAVAEVRPAMPPVVRTPSLREVWQAVATDVRLLSMQIDGTAAPLRNWLARWNDDSQETGRPVIRIGNAPTDSQRQ